MGQTTLGENLRRIEAEIAAGRPDQALTQCQELQTRYPRVLAVQRVLGETYLALRKPREALAALERALAGDPEDARALCARAIVYQMHGDSMAALQWYRRACDVRPEDQVLRSTYHALAAHLGQPPYRPTRVGLARLYTRGDLFAHALREWEAIVAENPDLLEARVGLAETLWRAQRFEAAEEQCRRIVANVPSCVKASLLLAVMLNDTGQYEEARRLAVRAAELDPDQRIGQALFADRLAAGDAGLRALLAGEQLGAASGQRPQVSRPLVGARPVTSTLGSGRPVAGNTSLPLSALPAGGLPAEFQNLFSETEYMIWGPDEETRARQVVASQQKTSTTLSAPEDVVLAQHPAPPTPEAAAPLPEQPAVDPLARSASFVPPALIEQGAPLDETEARAAINWVNWLKAQGARAHPGLEPTTGGPGAPQPAPPSAHPRMTAPIPLEARQAPISPPTPSLPSLPAIPDADTVARLARPSGPIPPPSAESLRAMFAELAPAHARGEHESETQRLAAAQALRDGLIGDLPDPAVTLESLERQFSSSGFQSVEPQPGLLASLAAGAQPPLTDSAALQPVEPQIPPTAPQGPAPGDYPARLAYARQRRADGKLEDAIAEYRVVLQRAPELLTEVVDELRECLSAAPEHPDLHRLLGDARIKQGDYLGALEAYNLAVALSQPQEL